MKTIVLGIAIMGLALSATAVDKSQLDQRIQSITAKFTAMQENSATRVPANELAQAKGIVLVDRTGGALFVGFHAGNGLALARDASGNWSPVGFVSALGGSLGPQIGGGKDFYVVLLMTPAAAQTLKESNMDFGAQASAVGGTQSAGAQTSFQSQPPMMVYSQKHGLYAGASVKAGSVKVDNNANAVYYDKAVSMEDILFNGQVTPSPAQQDLVSKIEQYSK